MFEINVDLRKKAAVRLPYDTSLIRDLLGALL